MSHEQMMSKYTDWANELVGMLAPNDSVFLATRDVYATIVDYSLYNNPLEHVKHEITRTPQTIAASFTENEIEDIHGLFLHLLCRRYLHVLEQHGAKGLSKFHQELFNPDLRNLSKPHPRQ